MPDASSIIQHLVSTTQRPVLLVADENLDLTQLSPPTRGGQAITNRWDQHLELSKLGWHSTFCDYLWPENHATQLELIYRISKEKAVVHHIINMAAENLSQDSELILVGKRSEGIKTYAKKAQLRLGGARSEEKLDKDHWLIRLSKGTATGARLGEQDYAVLHEVAEVNGHRLCSKPGIFGWSKIDAGSVLLVERLPSLIHKVLPLANLRVLDLGCGSGYLSLATCSAETQIHSTDNNAAALQITELNLANAGFNSVVQASDAGTEISGTFDLILCNPPFHSGFGIDPDLTNKFSQQAARLLDPEGIACFVVNEHVPLGRIAAKYFNQVNLDINNGSFCVYSLTQPK